MAQGSKIEWTEVTWNPVTGCTKISPGCSHCYAERMAYRFAGLHGFPKRPNHFDVVLHPDRLEQPLKWRKPKLVFVNSMSDLFHKDVPLEFIQRAFEVMCQASRHTFQILTKRSDRLRDLNDQINWPDNVWMGVSVETPDYLSRVDHLRSTNAKVKFLSLEPLLAPLPHLNLQNIDWVIVGGESGPGARPILEKWVIDIRDQCIATSTSFFFKQWGGVNKKRKGRNLNGRTWDDMPVLQVGLDFQVASVAT